MIILGAGASRTSGYPLGDGLRLLLASTNHLKERMKGQLGEKFASVEADLKRWLDALEEPIRLFREGGFATVDEFNRFAVPHFDARGEYLRRMLSLCFAVHNPEDNFERSDYYRFIQKLFEDGVADLRTDVTVLTFNYDPYLEFLLRRAYMTRCEAERKAPSEEVEDAILSGFALRKASALETSDGFCLLKLHGTCALPTAAKHGRKCPTHEEFFVGDAVARFRSALDPSFMEHGFSPICFPWELIRPDGEFVGPRDFRERNDAKDRQMIGGYEGDIELYTVFKAIWNRAQREVQAATKLSFVGLSMHDYLKPGLAFLLGGRCGLLDVVVADTKPQKPIERLERWLAQFCHDLQFTPIRRRKDFEEFIQEEMDPLGMQTETSNFRKH